MSAHQNVIDAARDGLVYLPIGGAGEIGMNMYAYGCQGKWIVVECGITFGNETTPGIDVITADPAFLQDLGDDLLAMVRIKGCEGLRLDVDGFDENPVKIKDNRVQAMQIHKTVVVDYVISGKFPRD